MESLTSRVLLAVHDPRIRSAGGRPLSRVLEWGDAGQLAGAFIQEIEHVSYGTARFSIVERLDLDEFPVKADGFQYTERSYLANWRARRGFHTPDLVDYPRLLDQLDAAGKVARGEIDEVWLFAFPYAGYYESLMAGPSAFWCNAPPLPGLGTAGRRFVVMGFNYERGVGEMLESFGHRAESILQEVFAGAQGEADLWERFTRHEKTHPGRAEVGTVHFAPNSRRDYDWGNRRRVLSRCNAWYRFPDLSGPPRWVDCAEWGGGDIRLHHRWWFRHFPHVPGESGGRLHNWWAYVLDPDRIPVRGARGA